MFGRKKDSGSVPKGMGTGGDPKVEITAVWSDGGWEREFNGSIPAHGANNIEVPYYVAQATGANLDKIRIHSWRRK